MAETDDVAARLERQQQALKGLVRTLSSIREDYCGVLSDIEKASRVLSGPDAWHQMQSLLRAQGEIAEVTAGINHLHSCIGLSVVAHCITKVVHALPGADEDPSVLENLIPLEKMVASKVWRTDERRYLFARCFKILSSFNGRFTHLVDEVKRCFPEETADEMSDGSAERSTAPSEAPEIEVVV